MLKNSNTLQKKFLISLLIVTLTCSNFMLVGSNICKGLISYALDNSQIELNNEVEEDNEVICEVNVESTDIHKTKMQETTDFTENLKLHVKNVSNIYIEDVENSFYNSEEKIVENANLKYVKTTMNLEELKNLLGKKGVLEITDSEDNKQAVISLETIKELEELAEKIKENEEENDVETLINAPQTFTKTVEVQDEEENIVEEEQEEVRSYLNIIEDKLEITYVLEIKEIKFKVENINLLRKNEEDENEVNEMNFVIENTKSIFDVENLESLNYLKENKIYNFNKTEEAENETELNEETQDNQIENIIKFKNTITRANLETDNATLELGKTNNVNYRIILDTTSENSDLYKNPTFIIELPEAVETVNTAKSIFTVENDGEVFTEKEVSVITILGRKYILIKLTGEQTAESIVNGNTVINLSLELDLKNSEEQNQNTKLYYQNSMVTAYESGVGFDTDEAKVSLILASEEEQELQEMQNTQTSSDANNTRAVTTSNNSNYMETHTSITNDEKLIRVGEEFEYLTQIYKYKGNSLEDAKIEFTIPNGLEYLAGKIYTYNSEDDDYTTEQNIEGALLYKEDSKTINVDMNKLEESVAVIKIKVKASNLLEGEYSKTINGEFKLLQNGELIEQDNVGVTVSDAFLNVSVNANEKARIDDAIEYEVIVKNLGLFQSEEKTVKINIPDELEAGTIEIYSNEELDLSIPMAGKEDEITFAVGAEETIKIKFTALYETAVEKNKTVTAIVTLDGKEYNLETKLLRVGNYGENVEEDDEETPSNPNDPTNPSDPTNPEDPTNPSDPTNPEDPTNPNDPTNPENPGNPENPTNPNDPSNPENPGNPENPTNPNDPTNPEDPSKPNNPNEENTEKPEFDLSLTQSLKKITVTNSQGTTVYNYKDANFAKIEIHSKYMNGSTVTFEYEITVKNEGNIAGYARKIVDYLPSGLQFNSELNKDWYLGEDGNLFSVTLIDKLLNPEDTATLKLVLTKQMTNNNTGTVANIAEIYEATNEENLKDINSTPADKAEGQNDMAKVEVLITVATGTIILYTMLAIIVLTILGYGTIKIKNITLKKEGK